MDGILENVTVIDFETSGLNPETDRVVEMAAIRYINGSIAGHFTTFVRYDGIFPERISVITGINDKDLENGMTESSAFSVLCAFLSDSIIVAHNAAFDLGFLHFSMLRLFGKSFDNQFIDTLSICRDRNFYPHTLQNMCETYNITVQPTHRALSDVTACLRLLTTMHEEDPVDEYLNTLNYLEKYGPPKWAPEYAVLVSTSNRYQNRQKPPSKSMVR